MYCFSGKIHPLKVFPTNSCSPCSSNSSRYPSFLRRVVHYVRVVINPVTIKGSWLPGVNTEKKQPPFISCQPCSDILSSPAPPCHNSMPYNLLNDTLVSINSPFRISLPDMCVSAGQNFPNPLPNAIFSLIYFSVKFRRPAYSLFRALSISISGQALPSRACLPVSIRTYSFPPLLYSCFPCRSIPRFCVIPQSALFIILLTAPYMVPGPIPDPACRQLPGLPA